jgi:hypothetical protein
MTKEEKCIALKTMDLLYGYLNGKVGDKDSETIKEVLFGEFVEYDNGNRQYLFEQIKKLW